MQTFVVIALKQLCLHSFIRMMIRDETIHNLRVYVASFTVGDRGEQKVLQKKMFI